MVAGNIDIKTASAVLGHSTPRMLLERYSHESEARKQAALAAHPGTLGHILGRAGWAEQEVWTRTDGKIEEKLACLAVAPASSEDWPAYAKAPAGSLRT